jgi:hypothetical protein
VLDLARVAEFFWREYTLRRLRSRRSSTVPEEL